MKDPRELAEPVDDGAADHLTGMRIPALVFPATTGAPFDLVDAASGTLVLYVYPLTGRPGLDLPVGWDGVPGARGCTPQACAFRDLHGELTATGAIVAGLSSQTPGYQLEAARRLELPFPLLADPDFELAEALDLPTFALAGLTFYRRLTLVARAGVIETVFYPVFPANENAARVLAWLRDRDGTDAGERER